MNQCESLPKFDNNQSVYRLKHRDVTETVFVHQCPLCHSPHTYLVKVARIRLVNRSAAMVFNRLTKHQRLYRLFPCPETDHAFRVILTLLHTPREIIRDIEVIGPKKTQKRTS